MARRVEFYFDFGSPSAYLAYTQLPALVRDTGTAIVWRPVLLGAVHQASKNVSPASIPAKARWMNTDLARWARHYGVRFQPNPHIPINTLLVMRAAIAMQLRQPDRFERYVDAIFGSMWATPRNLNDPELLRTVLTAAGLDATRIFKAASDPDVKAELKSRTDEAVARGVFGTPTMFVDEEMFFGQDRLQFVREALIAKPEGDSAAQLPLPGR